MLAIDTIVVPQGAEYQAVCRGLQKARVNNIEVIAIAIGEEFVDRFLVDNRDKLDRATGVLIVGLCGSLTAAYSIGDSVLAKSCQNFNHHVVHLDPQLTAQIEAKIGVKTVMSLTSDRVITQAEEKLTLAQQYEADIVEMEGYGYVTKLRQQKISVAMLRVVSDDPNGDIPNLNRAIDAQGNLKTLPMAILLIKQPLAAVKLIKSSLAGLKALEQITTELFTDIMR